MADIIFEDNQVVVAVKPPNMLSQADDTGDTDILSEIKEHIKREYHKPGNVYIGLVHRLDRPVGGLMVFARNSKSAARLSAQLQEHEMGREYLCVAAGKTEDEFTLTDYLVMDRIRNRMVVCAADEKEGQLAVLHGRCIARREGLELCTIKLETGRKHQIRAQMSNIGAPLWGDNRYGNGIPGQQIALWGYKLSFIHPVSREVMVFHSMPEGGIWSVFADMLTVPEDLERKSSPRDINLSDEAAERISRYEKPPVERTAAQRRTRTGEDRPRLRAAMRGQNRVTREEIMSQRPGISLEDAEPAGDN